MKFNIVVFFNGERGFLVLRALLNEFGPNAIPLVVVEHSTQVAEADVKSLGCHRMIRVTNANDKDLVAEIKGLSPKLFVLAGFSQIFKASLLELPEFGTINLQKLQELQ